MIKIKILGERDMNKEGSIDRASLDRYEAGMEEAEKLHGGAGDNMPDSDFDPKELEMGIEDETGEHTSDPQIGKEIAKDHLAKDPKYYEKLKMYGLEEEEMLQEAKLSKYWKKRASRRAKRAKRVWPNKQDRDWALGQQTKSESINVPIHKLFEKEIEDSEQMLDDISAMLKNIKNKRKKKQEAKMMKPQEKLKNKKSLSKPYPPHKKGETVGGYYRKVSKKLGGIGAAPGEAIGPALEENKNENN